MNPLHTIHIEVYDPAASQAEAKYLVRGYSDVLWTNDLDEAMNFAKGEVSQASVTHHECFTTYHTVHGTPQPSIAK